MNNLDFIKKKAAQLATDRNKAFAWVVFNVLTGKWAFLATEFPPKPAHFNVITPIKVDVA